jgi:MFS family permease
MDKFLNYCIFECTRSFYPHSGILILGIFFSTLAPLMLFLMQLIPYMNPWWYYGVGAITGLVNWVAVALSALSDVLPQRFRAPGIGLVLAGFSLGIALSPVLAFAFNRLHLSLISYLVVVGGLVSTILYVPETLPPQVAEEARRRREDDNNNAMIQHSERTGGEETFWFRLFFRKAGNIVVRPVKEMSILNRNLFFRLVSSLAFFRYDEEGNSR